MKEILDRAVKGTDPRKTVLFLVLVPVLWFCVHIAFLLAAGLNDRLARSDAGVVFGSEVLRDGSPSPRLKARLDRAAELYRAGYFAKIIVSGGTGESGHDEAAVMAEYLTGAGIPPEAVITDSGGKDTMSSVRNALSIGATNGFRTYLAVSQYFHILRIGLAFRKCGVDSVGTAHARYGFELRDLYSIPREVAGFYAYLFAK